MSGSGHGIIWDTVSAHVRKDCGKLRKLLPRTLCVCLGQSMSPWDSLCYDRAEIQPGHVPTTSQKLHLEPACFGLLIWALLRVSFCCTVARRTCKCNIVICACKTSNAFLVQIFMALSKADLLHRKPASAGTCCETFMFRGTRQGTVCYGVLEYDGKWFYSYLGERSSSVCTLKLEVSKGK